jgi:hypothetical protein
LPIQGFYWAGEAAGALLTGYLNPEKLTMYTRKDFVPVREFSLMPEAKGDLEIFEIFWNEQEFDHLMHPATVPPLLVYAELATSLDSRNQETAQLVKEKYLDA